MMLAAAVRFLRQRCVCFVFIAPMFMTTLAHAQAPLSETVAKASAAMVEALRASDYPAIEARFDAHMHSLLPHDKFMATSTQISAQLGTLQDCDEPRGRLRESVTTVEYRCRFTKATILVRLAWNEQLELTGLVFLPVPAEPAEPVPLPPNMREEAVTTGAPGWPLPGTLLIPTTRAKPPIVVMIHGSGPNDRDESIPPNKPFLDLALGFAQSGIASLRYDKRTRALGARFATELKTPTLDDEVVDDAVAALALVSKRSDFGPVFIVGHSMGAWLAPRIAASAAKQGVQVAGIVMLAGNVTPLADLVVYQYEFLSQLPVPTATKENFEDEKRRRANLQRLMDQPDPAHATAEQQAPLPLGLPASMWIDIARYDPAATLLAEPRLPALLTFGERDFQVPIREKALWEARLKGRPNTTIVAFPGLNHLLMTGTGPVSPAEYTRPDHVSQALIDRVTGWIDQRATPGR
jgi:uncharacterized protein